MRVSTDLAGVERLAFSITWDLTPKGKILAQWAGRSIIKSCVKLAYGHAQDMIEGKFAGLPDQEAPSVELHGYAWPEVCPSCFPCLLSQQECTCGLKAASDRLHDMNWTIYFCCISYPPCHISCDCVQRMH